MSDAPAVLGRFARPTAEDVTRIAVLSDLHLTTSNDETWRVERRTEERLEAAVDSLEQQELDAVLFNGDLVQSGTRQEYERFDRIVDGVTVPFLATPGNHDLTGFGSGAKRSLAEFERQYAPDRFPYHERIGGVDLLALNSTQATHDSLPKTYTGRLSPESLAWLDETLRTVDAPVVAVHHNLDNTRGILYDSENRFDSTPGSPGFENADELVAVLRKRDAPLVLTGHVHFPAIVRSGAVREFTLPALGPYPCAYTVLEIDESGTTAYFHPVAGREAREEALESGLENNRVLLAAAQLAGLPLHDEFAARPGGERDSIR